MEINGYEIKPRINLNGENLCYADLRGANLHSSNLRGVHLRGVHLEDSNLRGVDFRNADLRDASLVDANLCYADLRGANLRGANLKDANLENIKTNYLTIGLEIACPKEGSFIGYKKANDYIIKLKILEDSRRSSATTRKCRCDKALVLDIYKDNEHINSITSNWDSNFIYEVGKIVKVDDYEKNRWIECASGIHFFISENNAMNYS